MTDYDTLIAGGGPVGSALALALAQGGQRVAVIERRAELPPAGNRAIALAAGSARLLDALGLWSTLASDAVGIRQVEVSTNGHFGRTRITAAEMGLPALGYVVGYGALARTLAASARDHPDIDWLAPTEVTDAHVEDAAIRVTTEMAGDQAGYSARLAVAAEGTESPLRRAFGIGTYSHDYAQHALIFDVNAGGDATVAHERFTRDGTLALLPRGGARRTLVWALDAETAAERADWPLEYLQQRLAAELGADHAPLQLNGTPVSYPLQRVEAETLVAERGVVIGNAARTLHPVAAQGFNLALRDTCALAERVLAAADPGDAGVLAAWQRSRRPDQWLTRDFTDFLARAFGHAPPALGGVRAALLLGLDLCPAGRQLLADQTTGLAHRLPRVGRWRPEAWT